MAGKPPRHSAGMLIRAVLISLVALALGGQTARALESPHASFEPSVLRPQLRPNPNADIGAANSDDILPRRLQDEIIISAPAPETEEIAEVSATEQLEEGIEQKEEELAEETYEEMEELSEFVGSAKEVLEKEEMEEEEEVAAILASAEEVLEEAKEEVVEEGNATVVEGGESAAGEELPEIVGEDTVSAIENETNETATSGDEIGDGVDETGVASTAPPEGFNEDEQGEDELGEGEPGEDEPGEGESGEDELGDNPEEFPPGGGVEEEPVAFENTMIPTPDPLGGAPAEERTPAPSPAASEGVMTEVPTTYKPTYGTKPYYDEPYWGRPTGPTRSPTDKPTVEYVPKDEGVDPLTQGEAPDLEDFSDDDNVFYHGLGGKAGAYLDGVESPQEMVMDKNAQVVAGILGSLALVLILVTAHMVMNVSVCGNDRRL